MFGYLVRKFGAGGWFSGRGVKLMDALESTSANTVRTIYLNNNGAHYGPILRVDST